jgi:hypothetical protein
MSHAQYANVSYPKVDTVSALYSISVINVSKRCRVGLEVCRGQLYPVIATIL